MKIKIKNRFDLSIIYECEADSLKIAVELAVKSRADLYGADLSGADLSRANLYGANLSRADLYGANLSGEKLDKNPIQILGMMWWVLITKEQIQIGCQRHKAVEWFKFKDKEISAMHEDALVWWKANKKIIKAIWENHCN